MKPMTARQKLYAVWTFYVVNLKRLFRDKMALFFTFLFPLIFLFVFGGLNNGDSEVTFKVAIINHSDQQFAKEFAAQLAKQKIFEVDKNIKTQAAANEKMSRSELDATIELPKNFGAVPANKSYPAGQAIVRYTENNKSAATTLTTVLQAQLQATNSKLVPTETPLTVTSEQNNERSLRPFDYTFAGLLGFAILGSGLFGPMSVFPELKKAGVLRRFHTTPLRVWQYFLSIMLGNAVVGLMSLSVMFLVALLVFDLKIVGNLFELVPFLVLGIITILGIGLAIGGWAQNERQAAPLGNLIAFPLMFLSGAFIPRFIMPDWLQDLTFFIPLTPIIDGARLIATEGKHLVDLGPQLGVMAFWIITVYTIAFKVFRWE